MKEARVVRHPAKVYLFGFANESQKPFREVAPRVSRAEAAVVLSHPSLEVIRVPNIVGAVSASQNVHEEGSAHRSDDGHGVVWVPVLSSLPSMGAGLAAG